jgi:hypothetical protein
VDAFGVHEEEGCADDRIASAMSCDACQPAIDNDLVFFDDYSGRAYAGVVENLTLP